MIRTIMAHPRTRQAGALGALAAALLLTGAAQADTKVGVTAAVNPEATGKPPSSQERVLYVGVDMQADERIRTTANGRVQLLFLDGSALSIGPDSDVVIDKYVYNPDNADNPGELAFRATKGVFRLIGGKISKVNPVVMHTSTASIGVRGSGALINAPEGGEKSTAIFLHGKDLFVQCDVGACQGEKTVVTRAGSAIDFARDLISSPYLAGANLIKTIQAGFERPATGLGEIAPAAGPGGPAGGGTPDDKLAATNIGNTNSGSAGNNLLPPPLNNTPQPPGDPISKADEPGKNPDTFPPPPPPPPENTPPPPPPPPSFSGTFTEGRFVAGPIDPNNTFDSMTLAYTPDPANNTPITSAVVSDGNNHVTLPNSDALDVPYLNGSFTWETSSSSQLLSVGFGFGAADNTFFRNWGIDLSDLQNPRTFEVYGGVPTAVFPTTGYATHQILGIFNGFGQDLPISSPFLPFMDTGLTSISVPLFVGQPGVTVSPLYSAYSSTFPTSGTAFGVNAFPVTLQASLAIIGQGDSQSSMLLGQVGTYVKTNADADVTLAGRVFGSYRQTSTSVPTIYVSGSSTQLTQAGTNSIFGPDAEFIVVGPDRFPIDTNANPVTFARQSSLGLSATLGNPTASSYYFQTTFQKVDPSQATFVGASTVPVTDLGTRANPTQQTTYSGYVAGIADVFRPAVAPNPAESFSALFQGQTGTPQDVQITVDPTTNRAVATFLLQSQPEEAINAITLQFGGLTGVHGSDSSFIDDRHFALAESQTTASTFNELAVASKLFMVTNAVVPVDPAGGFLPEGVSLCTCQYMQWGWWTGTLNHNDPLDNNPGERDWAHLSTWVAGSLPAVGDLPQTGAATYNGHIIGNVVNGASSYLAAGAFSQNWNFATRVGALTITNFDGKNFAGTTTGSAANVNFSGSFTGTNAAAQAQNITGQLNGSFFKSPTDAAAYQAGQFVMGGTNYVAAGTFAAQR